ncbi:MAG: UvrABC system protein A [Betaproteobacteria bacterium]|nr:MAG: UvrABC system protein A [Betaproteobacteria bacterium]
MPSSDKAIRIRGARQNNLKNLDVDLPTGELIVVTGVSGSGKSSLAFDTLYAEGQRRYVETFSPYARQFLDRMDRPQVDRIEGVPPAIAIDQTNPVRTSRSTVGTMTELNDHLKLLFARAGTLYCRGCGKKVARDTATSIVDELFARCAAHPDARITITFPVRVPKNFKEEEVRAHLEAQGYTRVHGERSDGEGRILDVVQDRLRTGGAERQRVAEAVEAALRFGGGRVDVHVLTEGEQMPSPQPSPTDVGEGAEGSSSRRPSARTRREGADAALSPPPSPRSQGEGDEKPSRASAGEGGARSAPGEGAVWRFSDDLHCADCDIHYAEPNPSTFSFNSPLGACDVCRGFGRVIGVDYGLVIPDESKTLREGAVRPWQTKSFAECQRDLEKFAPKFGVPLDTPWKLMKDEHRRWVLEGQDGWTGKWQTQWYGIRRFFDWLESKAYKMHIRVLLSKYRAYTPCTACGGARLKPDALLWRVGSREDAEGVLIPHPPPNRPLAGGGDLNPPLQGEGRGGDGVRGHYRRFKPIHAAWTDAQLEQLPGLSIHDLMLLPIEHVRAFFERISFAGVLDAATELLLEEVRARLRFLCDVGLGYLTLDRQSRTLSGGEVQRINLTTALGTSLVNTLFVLDEPSIGLHPRDMHRVIEVMHRLRDAGNSLVVVEHDPQVMLAADRMLDMGPGPGERGGSIVFNGTPNEIRRAATLTGDYLAGRRQVEVPSFTPDGYATRNVRPNAPRLVLEGAREHNLKNLSLEFPLNHLVVVTGVSGSGKSTLVQDVLYPALCKAKGKATETPGAHDRLLGDDWIADVAMVDQSPIGKTTRSNPASYVGAWDAIRKLFGNARLAKERNYTAGMFSFNAGDGRCPTCGGNGFEHVEMQFLSDVYLRCPDCDGKRFRAEVLEVTLERDGRALSVADVLDLTVNEALQFFAGEREVVRGLQPLADVGLEYVKLGQPVPTLSGGEAQRLKIAGFLAEAAKSGIDGGRLARKGSLLLFDEPTTGLHFDDVAKLMRALRKLLAAGHSLIVIEHNLDVIRSADWIIDLGPEGGDAGGEVVAIGTPREVMEHPTSHTGRALREYETALAPSPRTRGEGWGEGLAAGEGVSRYLATPHPQPSPLARGEGAYLANAISIRHAREHNLKNIDVEIPRDKLTVITGVSGSGKSTLAFDILFNEGQRRYLESLNAYARSIVQPAGKPDVDAIYGIPPTVAIEQRTSRGGRKSTVATMTEVYHFLRLLYQKLGVQHCPDCRVPVTPQSFEAIAAAILREFRGRHIGLLAPLVVNRKGLYTDLAKWARQKGYTHLRVDGEFVPTAKWPRLDRFKEHTIELPVGDLIVYSNEETALRTLLATALEHGHGIVNVIWPLDRLKAALLERRSDNSPRPGNGERGGGEGSRGARVDLDQRVFSTKRACPSCGTSFPEPDPRLFSYNSKHGWCPDCYGTGLALQGFDAEQTGEEIWWNAWYEGETVPCETCHGQRLNRVALAVKWQGRSIAELAAGSVADAKKLFASLALEGREEAIARDVLAEIRSRLAFLSDVGLGYLALDRAAPTLSGGEAQRIRLAAQLGSNLQGVCYVLDEPTIGLHPHDNRILLDTLEALRDKGNTLLVVEHDEDTIRRADHVIDIGPGAGRLGGHVIATGHHEELATHPDSVTGRFLAQPLAHPLGAPRPAPPADGSDWLVLRGAHLHNLRHVNAHIPLRRMTVVTGVSGSGKSTLARDVLLANAAAQVQARNQRKAAPPLAGVERIEGWEGITRVLEVDQTPIGKTPRSCPATYVGFWDAIRRLFADTGEARIRGWSPSRFSFNTGGGRCALCDGQGQQTIEMSFLPDVKVLCDACGGRRFNPETLELRLRGRNIGDVLAMDVDEAVGFFAAHPAIAHPLRLLQDVGLGYLTLGQPSPTLSGGEAQRIKLVTELAKVRVRGEGADDDPRIARSRAKAIAAGRAAPPGPHTLYVLDEPTVGLHMADVEKLIRVLHRLVDAGNTLVVVEHNLDIWAEADWIVDLGPDGGVGGGRIVATGTPATLAARAGTRTERALRTFLDTRPAPDPALAPGHAARPG